MKNKDAIEVVRGTVSEVIYRNKDNSYTVIKVKVNKEEIVVNSIKAKDAIIIESDLSLAQWESVKLNLTENVIV